MKYFIAFYLITISFFSAEAKRADEPQPFDKFFKKTMKVTDGIFPVYQDGNKYYLEISKKDINQDILVIADIAKGISNDIANSSGVVRFSLGNGQNLNVTRQIYNQTSSDELDPGMESLIQQSSMIPISYVLKVVAKAKDERGYIIDVTTQLLEGGELFSFKEISNLSHPDPSRSGIQAVNSSTDGVMFSVLRTQTDQIPINNNGKKADRAIAFVLNLGLQRLPKNKMSIREADPRFGFATVSLNDFGKTPYAIREIKAIKKWDIKVSEKDLKKYNKGILVQPEKPILVSIDEAMPKVYVPYIKDAIESWNKAFATAGYKDVLVLDKNKQRNWLTSGKLLIKWGNAFNKVEKTTLEDPRTGEIFAAKLNVSDFFDDAMSAYFISCGLNDKRVIRSLTDVSLKGEIIRLKLKESIAEILGILPNPYAGTAYTVQEIRSPEFLSKNGFTSSVTDGNVFNYVAQPEDNVPVSSLMPDIGAYDKIAINWAYRIFPSKEAIKSFEHSITYQDKSFRYKEDNKDDPFTQPGVLTSNPLNAAELRFRNMQKLYPQLKSITGNMKGGDEYWLNYLRLATAFQMAYTNNVLNMATFIGGETRTPVIRGYNDIAVHYVPKQVQQDAFSFLEKYLFKGVPAWMVDSTLKMTNNEIIDYSFQRTSESALNRLISSQVISNLIKAENMQGKSAFTVEDLFKNLNRIIFKDFDIKQPMNAYEKGIQATFVYNLAQAANKDSFLSGLTDANEVLHAYFMDIMENVIRLSKTHPDPSLRASYKLMKMKIDQEYFQK